MIRDNQNYSERDLKLLHKTREICILKNKMKRYGMKLAAEAMRVAKQKGIESEIVDLNNLDLNVFVDSSETIPIYQDGEAINADILLKLAQPRFPALYRRYIQMQKRYEITMDELEKIVHQN